jgi:hypothetical protein
VTMGPSAALQSPRVLGMGEVPWSHAGMDGVCKTVLTKAAEPLKAPRILAWGSCKDPMQAQNLTKAPWGLARPLRAPSQCPAFCPCPRWSHIMQLHHAFCTVPDYSRCLQAPGDFAVCVSWAGLGWVAWAVYSGMGLSVANKAMQGQSQQVTFTSYPCSYPTEFGALEAATSSDC